MNLKSQTCKNEPYLQICERMSGAYAFFFFPLSDEFLIAPHAVVVYIPFDTSWKDVSPISYSTGTMEEGLGGRRWHEE